MSWSYRKSFSSGPFRINFSKSGISYSVGIKGARVNVSPKGTYVNLSSQGITYRRKIADSSVPVSPVIPQMLPGSPEAVHTIASANIEQLTDTDSKDFIVELTQKARQISYARWFGVFPFIIFLLFMAFTSFNRPTVVSQAATNSVLVKVSSDVGVNIRQAADAQSAILRVAASGQVFNLLDSTDKKWLKVGFNDSVGYVRRTFAVVANQHDDQEQEETFLLTPYAVPKLASGLLFFIILIPALKKADKRRFGMELHYEMDEHFKNVYKQFNERFATFSRSARVWQYLDARQTNDYKRNGGAGKLIKRIAVSGIFAHQTPLPHFVTNVTIPCLKLRNIEFYFLPERLVIKRDNAFAAVFYKNLQIDGHTTRFIEDESVAPDADVVGQTWRYVNKQGGPDRRFNNNRRIPICAYSEYTITSDTGIYEVITTSKKGAMDDFVAYLAQIGDLQSRIQTS